MSEKRKERVFVPDEEFIPKYKEAFDSGVKLSDFAVQIGQAEGTITQRIAKYNKMLKDYAPRFAELGIAQPPKLGYLKTGDGTGKRERKALTPVELIELMGLKLDSPI